MIKEHAEALHGIVRLIIVRVAPFRRPLGIFSSTTFVDAAKQNVVRLSLNLPEAYFTCESILWLSDAFADGGGTKGASQQLSRGLFGFVALRRYAEECAFSLSTQAQDHVWDLVEYKRVEPAHCPAGATSGGAGCEQNIMRGIPPSFESLFMHYARALFFE